MLVKANSTMMFNQKEFKLLGGKYKNEFEIGQYVEWRVICRNKNYEENVKVYQGIIVGLRTVDVGGRNVWYADIMKNGGETDLILVSKIRKIETN
jgi:hypothetical protein